MTGGHGTEEIGHRRKPSDAKGQCRMGHAWELIQTHITWNSLRDSRTATSCPRFRFGAQLVDPDETAD